MPDSVSNSVPFTTTVHARTDSMPRWMMRWHEGKRPRGLVLSLALDCATTLDNPPYCIVSREAQAAGFAAASFDLPCHGDEPTERGAGLTGIAAEVAAGGDPFARIRAAGRYVVDQAVAQWGDDLPIGVTGVSRGGLSAMHVMAADPRVAAAAVICPVTHLPALTEFAALADNPVVRSANAAALIPRLTARPLFIAINDNDPRVITQHCLEFADKLRANGGDVTLRLVPGNTHRVPEEPTREAAAFLLAKLLTAEETRRA